MLSIEQNIKVWSAYDWNIGEGAEWSLPWGGVEQQWLATIYPRIYSFIPCGNILEIAVGYGRWGHFLNKYCEKYYGVDIVDSCVNTCKKKFPDGEFFVNDGKSLSMIKSNSIDFCFSYESLLHIEIDDLESYVQEILRVLKPDGIAFINHSNLKDVKKSLIKDNHFWRAKSVSAKEVRKLIEKYNGKVLVQEAISSSDILLDAISVFHKSDKIKSGSKSIIQNKNYQNEWDFGSDVISKYSLNSVKNTNLKKIKDICFENY